MGKSENWKILELHNGEFSCENIAINSDELMDILNLLGKEFDVDYNNRSAAGFDGVYIDVKINGYSVTVGWDVWSGVFIMSNDVSGNDTIKQIYSLLSEKK